MSEYLKSNIEKLIQLENEENMYKEKMGELKKEKESVSDNILTFMERNNITNKDIIFGNSKIKYTQTKVQEAITKKRIQDRLTLYLKSENLAKEATDFIYSDKNYKINKSIKIINDLKR